MNTGIEMAVSNVKDARADICLIPFFLKNTFQECAFFFIFCAFY